MCIFSGRKSTLLGMDLEKSLGPDAPFSLQQQEEKVRTADDPFKFSVIYLGDQPCHMALAAPIGNLLYKFLFSYIFVFLTNSQIPQ